MGALLLCLCLLGCRAAAASVTHTAKRIKNLLVSKVEVVNTNHGRSLFTAGTQGNYDQSDAYAWWAFTSLGWENHPSELQPCTTAQPNLDLDLCEEYVMARYGKTLSSIIQNTDAPGNKRTTGCYRHKSDTNFVYNLHSDGNNGAWNQQRVVCRDHQLITYSPTSAPVPPTPAPTAAPTLPAGWPEYYTWGTGVGCPCVNGTLHASGNPIESGDGCHDILDYAECLNAYTEIYADSHGQGALPGLSGYYSDLTRKRGCTYLPHTGAGGHDLLINYATDPTEDAYAHIALCKNHHLAVDAGLRELYLPLFDPASEWVEYVSNSCGPANVAGYGASTGVCPTRVENGVAFLGEKVAMVHVNATHTTTDGVTRTKWTQDACDYYGWVVYHCVEGTNTAAPTGAPTTAPSDSPTVPPTHTPTSHAPTSSPSAAPSAVPSAAPSPPPTSSPSASPTPSITVDPTIAPSSQPSTAPTNAPTDTPTNPTMGPTTDSQWVDYQFSAEGETCGHLGATCQETVNRELCS